MATVAAQLAQLGRELVHAQMRIVADLGFGHRHDIEVSGQVGHQPLLNHGIAEQLVEPGTAFFCSGHDFASFDLAQHFQHMLTRNLDDRQIPQPGQDVFV